MKYTKTKESFIFESEKRGDKLTINHSHFVTEEHLRIPGLGKLRALIKNTIAPDLGSSAWYRLKRVKRYIRFFKDPFTNWHTSQLRWKLLDIKSFVYLDLVWPKLVKGKPTSRIFGVWVPNPLFRFYEPILMKRHKRRLDKYRMSYPL